MAAPLGDTTTATRTGPAVVDVGRAPSTADAIIADITCLSDSGVVRVPTGDGSTGSAIHCSRSPTGTMHVIDGQLPAKGSSDFRDDAYGQEWTGPIDIYRTDGVTVIGVATPAAETLPEVPLDQGLIDDLDSVRTASPVPPAR